MILTCPQCSTRYQTDAAKFAPSGRTVRCAKCGQVWHQDAPAAEPDPASDVFVAEAPPEPVVAPPVMPAPAPVEVAVARPAAYAPNPVMSRERAVPAAPRAPSNLPMRLAVGAGWLGLVAIVLLIGWSALRFRQQIATVWPQSASLYSAVGLKANASGINIEDVAYHRGLEDGQSVLSVTGVLTNTSTRELPVPQLRIALIDDDRRELYHWSFVPGVLTLKPGQTTKFLTRLSNPPAAASHFELRFAKAGE
jgi:predicted Zn finger-like uncharacterized protein